MPVAYSYSGGAGGLAGASPRSYSPASGGVPGVTDPGVSLQNLLASLSGNMGAVSGVESGLTGAASNALRSQYSPEYFDTLAKVTGNANRRAGGDITDLMAGLQQSQAENATATGMSGSAASNSKLLKDLGLTRYGVEEQALSDLGAIKGATPTVAPFDLSRILPSIADQLAAQERADIYRSAPVPEEAYMRARAAAGGGGGGGTGWNSGGPARVRSGGGGGGVDDILKRYGQTSMAPTIASGTAPDESPWAMPSLPYNPSNFGAGGVVGGGRAPIVSGDTLGSNLMGDSGAPWNYGGLFDPILGGQDLGGGAVSQSPDDYGIPWDEFNSMGNPDMALQSPNNTLDLLTAGAYGSPDFMY